MHYIDLRRCVCTVPVVGGAHYVVVISFLNHTRRFFNGGRGSCVVANSFLGRNETVSASSRGVNNPSGQCKGVKQETFSASGQAQDI